MSKPQIISDKNKKSLRIKNILTKKIEANQFKKSNYNRFYSWHKLHAIRDKNKS